MASGDWRGLVLLAGWMLALTAPAQPVQVGSGRYFLAPRGADRPLPAATGRVEALQQLAAPTNQWYSTLVFSPRPEAIHVQPLSVRPTATGLEVALPQREAVASARHDVEVRYPHRQPLLISPLAFEPEAPRLARADDWSIDMSLARGPDDMRVTVAHGSPFASVRLTRGDVRLRLPGPAVRLQGLDDPRVLALKLDRQAYAVFGPTGVRWEQVSATEWIGRLPAGAGYLAVAGLPDEQPQTLALLLRHAYAFIQETRVSWHYDQAGSAVDTTFSTKTQVMEGEDHGPLLGLYPHQWFDNPTVADRLGPSYDTVRGPIRLLAASQFSTRLAHVGFVPWWPGLRHSARQGELQELLDKDVRNARRMMLQEGRGAYWQGKGLQRTIKLADVAEAQGDAEARQQLLAMARKRIEEWFVGDSARGYFHYDRRVGALASYPDEFFAVEQINDHHFTYGYWIRTMAEMALRDPQWASPQQWGGLVDVMVSDIATATRGSAEFPFLRNFDPYEGHSWASGVGLGEFGNNQESSSEAVNAWAGIILWGLVTGRPELTELGIYLYASEINAIQHYWFDIHRLVLAPEYRNVEVSQLFGGQYVHNTWWTDEPRQIKGINLLPITTASLYLGRDPEYVKRNLAALKPEMELYDKYGKRPNNPPPPDVWQDIFAKYLALADPAAGLAQWNRWGAVELGDSRSHALHWLLSLQEMGPPDFQVTADTPLYSVFRQADGRRTYLAFNASKAPLAVKFSDGQSLVVAPRSLGVLTP